MKIGVGNYLLNERDIENEKKSILFCTNISIGASQEIRFRI